MCYHSAVSVGLSLVISKSTMKSSYISAFALAIGSVSAQGSGGQGSKVHINTMDKHPRHKFNG